MDVEYLLPWDYETAEGMADAIRIDVDTLVDKIIA